MTIASQISRLQNDKAAMKTAIENKGVTVGNVTFDSYAACIDAIPSGGGESVGYIDFLMVGGGGAGAGGGGGGGGFVEGICQAIYSRSYPVIIGHGGLGSACGACRSGGDTIFYGVAYGGGAGAYAGTAYDLCPNMDGASGGGGHGYKKGLSIYVGQGYRGGCSLNSSCCYGGGGGGAGGAGCIGCSTNGSGGGGIGRQSSITGEAHYYAGGGGGCTCNRCCCSPGGQGGGGCGGVCQCRDATYYGGGGGGYGGNGCQGIVIVRYPADGSYCFSSATGGDSCYVCNGYCVHIFTTDGVFTPIF